MASSRARATYGKGPLSRPSIPDRPGWPSKNNNKKWLTAIQRAHNTGIDLLLKYYSEEAKVQRRAEPWSVVGWPVLKSSILSETEVLRNLVICLAMDHVPFFQVRKKKKKAVDNHVLAKLLHEYYGALQENHDKHAARKKAARKLPRSARLSDRRIQNVLSQARRMYINNLVVVTEDGSLRPTGKLQGRLWGSLVKGAPSSAIAIEPDPHDSDGILVPLSDR